MSLSSLWFLALFVSLSFSSSPISPLSPLPSFPSSLFFVSPKCSFSRCYCSALCFHHPTLCRSPLSRPTITFFLPLCRSSLISSLTSLFLLFPKRLPRSPISESTIRNLLSVLEKKSSRRSDQVPMSSRCAASS